MSETIECRCEVCGKMFWDKTEAEMIEHAKNCKGDTIRSDVVVISDEVLDKIADRVVERLIKREIETAKELGRI